MRCLEPSEIDRYVSGLMDRKVAEEVGAHLEGCPRCRRAVADARERAPGLERATVRVQCTTCGARYGIPEERVRGRMLKVRCKACGTILEVRGGPNAPGRSVLERGRKQWFLVIRRERVGPMTDQEVRERFQRGEIKPRTYVWRQGFSRWERLLSVAEFQDLVADVAGVAPRPKRSTRPLPELAGDPAQTRAVKPPPGRASEELEPTGEALDFESARPGQGHDPGADLDDDDGDAGHDTIQDEASPAVDRLAPEVRGLDGFDAAFAPFADPQGEDGGYELRPTTVRAGDRGAGRRPGDLLPDELASAPAPSSDPDSGGPSAEVMPGFSGQGEPHLRGQRNEDSVLFSLSHLQQVARRQIKLPEKPAEPTGFTDLVDIRPVAAAPASIPLVLPSEEGRRAPPLVLLLAVGLGGMLLGAASLAGVIYLVRPDLARSLLAGEPVAESGTAAAQEARPPPPVLPRVSPLPPKPGAASSSVAPAVRPGRADAGRLASTTVAPPPAKGLPAAEAGGPLAAAEGRRPVPGASEPEPEASRPARKPRRKRIQAQQAASYPVAPEGEQPSPSEGNPRPEPKKENLSRGELDSLVDGAKQKAIAKKTTAQPAGPEAEGKAAPGLSREQVAAGMKRALAALQVCNEKFAETGTITVEVTIEPTGRISKGKVLGAFSGSAIADCVLEAVKRNATFPAFSGTALVVKHPFVLRGN